MRTIACILIKFTPLSGNSYQSIIFFENNIDQCEIHKEIISPPDRERASPRQLHCFVSTIATWKRCNKCALAMEMNFPTPFL